VKTYSAKAADIERQWWIVDAASASLGRLASEVASILRGKNKPIYTPHVDTGDHVIVINCDQLVLTGRKLDGKIYDRYSGYHGGRTEVTARERVANEPEEVVRDAVRGMLPKNRLGRQMLTKLKVYRGSEHPHGAQQPQPLTLQEAGE
jgi:large subunit ribosomal protein L13